MNQEISDEQLMLFADGELDASQARKIETALAEDNLLAERLALFTKSRIGVAEAFAPATLPPVPRDLKSRIESMVTASEKTQETAAGKMAVSANSVMTFPSRIRQFFPRYDLAVAASIALIAGGVIGFSMSTFMTPDKSGDVIRGMAELSRPGIVTAIRTVASGDEIALEDGSRFKAIASFKDESGNLCREVELDNPDMATIVAVTCAENNTWNVRFTVIAASVENGYAPASSLEALDAYLQAVGAGDPMSLDEEKSELDAL